MAWLILLEGYCTYCIRGMEIFWDKVVNILLINGLKLVDVLELRMLCFG